MESTRLTDKSRVAKGIETLAGDADCTKHDNPALSGVLYAIAGLPLETLAAVGAILRLALSDNSTVAQSVIDEVFENELCLVECEPNGSEKHPAAVYFWNGISNAVQIAMAKQEAA